MIEPVYQYNRCGTIYSEEYLKDNKRHREDGPAYTGYYLNGQIRYEEYRIEGHVHRENGPASIMYYDDGKYFSKEYRIDSNLHRLDGPACIFYHLNGAVEVEIYYIKGTQYFPSSLEDFKKLVKLMVFK